MKNTRWHWMVVAALAAASLSWGQTVKVDVHKGEVLVRADGQQNTVSAGQVATAGPGKKLEKAVKNPLVAPVMQIIQWADQERQSGRLKIDYMSAQAARVLADGRVTGCALTDMDWPRERINPDGSLKMGETTLDDVELYDMQGNPIAYTNEPTRKRDGLQMGYMHVRYPPSQMEGSRVRMLMSFPPKDPPKPERFQMLSQEGDLWTFCVSNGTPNCLNYFHVVLPESAVLLTSTDKPIAIGVTDGCVALTFRNYTGPQADGAVRVRFLWPSRDKTSLSNVPAAARGQGDPYLEAMTQQYSRAMGGIQAGRAYEDVSTPIGALLTYTSGCIMKNATLLDKAQPGAGKRAADPKDADERASYWAMREQFVWAPPVPTSPKEGELYPIWVGTPGSGIRTDTQVFTYHGGRWYRVGNQGNPVSTDLKPFESYRDKMLKDINASNSHP